MTDRIDIHDLMIRAIVGINDDERVNRQDVVINITLWTDTAQAGRTDEIDDTINYRTLSKRVIELVEESSFFLVEKLAAEIARVGLEFSDSIERVRISVEKPGAVRFARSVGITIERTRDEL
jgi:D-erythro-7,8-dihydroneopterin triphosphate epimerase|tara:strand:- start:2270 stop:2635 length:366 start_codon:yes stop_codon:yes gene_type:complete